MKQIASILALFVLSVQFSGCAITPEPAQEKELEIKRVWGKQHEIEQAELPAVPLTGDILYDLLVGEMAGQRGELLLSVRHYLQAAMETRDPRIAERATRIAIYARLDAESLRAAKIWVETDPDNLMSHQVISGLYMRQGEAMAAIPHLEKLLAFNDGEAAKRLLMISNLLSKQQDKQAALQAMEKLLETRQDNADALYAYGYLALQANKPELAETIINKVLALRPDWVEAIVIKGRILMSLGHTTQAMLFMEKAVDDQSDNTVLHLSYGRMLVDLNESEKAYGQFRWLVKNVPDNEDILYTLAALALQTNRLDEARKYFLKLEEGNQNTGDINFYLGQIEERQKNNEPAIEFYSRVTPEQPNYFNAQIRIAFLLQTMEGLDSALSHLHGVNAKQPRDRVRLYIVEGEMLSNAGRNDEAMTLFNSAISAMPDNNDLLYARAMVAEKMDKLDLLERDLLKILEREPDNAQALNALGYTLADHTNRLQEALNYVSRAHELDPTSSFILDSMGWVKYRMGEYDEAIKYLKRAINLHWEPEIAAHLGEVLWVKGDQSGAREIWDSALQKAPGDKLLLEVIKRFDK